MNHLSEQYGDRPVRQCDMQMPPYRPDKPRLTRAVTFDPAPDNISGSETVTLDTKTPLEQQLEHESSSQSCSSLSVLNLVQKGTFTPNDKRIPGVISEPNSTVDLPEKF